MAAAIYGEITWGRSPNIVFETLVREYKLHVEINYSVIGIVFRRIAVLGASTLKVCVLFRW
jgi:hypothetical protein